MKKKFTIFLILIFVLGLTPVNFSVAITQNQIDAEVQIVCTDGAGSWFSGSGTIIDPKGIILTNRHVIEGAYQNTCIIGFIESISDEPVFGEGEIFNLAEVKYYTATDDMDVAILYLENPTNKTYPYINIWNSNSNALQFGDKIEVIGFPSIGGSTITYTSGDFSGYGSGSNKTQNYIKTTAPLEHGNSGGAAYNSSGNFIGIPTMVVPGKLNSLSYVLSVDSIKNWLSSTLGANYQSTITNNNPTPRQNVTLQQDLTPPDISKLDDKNVWFSYWATNNLSNQLEYVDYIDNNYTKGSIYKNIKIYFGGTHIVSVSEDSIRSLNNVDANGIVNTYYYVSKNLSEIKNNLGKKLILNYDEIDLPHDRRGLALTDIITLPEEGLYYIGIKFEDAKGNISESLIFAYSYDLVYQDLIKISYYSDPELTNLIGEFEYNNFIDNPHKEVAMLCGTSLKTIYARWDYKKRYNKYMVKLFPKVVWSIERGGIDDTDYELTSANNYKLDNLDKGMGYNYRNFCYHGVCRNDGPMSSFVLKPYINEESAYFTGAQNLVALIEYHPKFPFKMACGQQGEVYNAELKIGETKNYSDLYNRLSGQILLQVEENGEAYYIYPENKRRYFLGRPEDAFQVMRELGLGATHDFITSHTTYPANVLGKILIDVEQNGEAYYIYPKDKKAYYLGRPADAFRIMRELGLGITNNDLSKIPEGNL